MEDTASDFLEAVWETCNVHHMKSSPFISALTQPLPAHKRVSIPATYYQKLFLVCGLNLAYSFGFIFLLLRNWQTCKSSSDFQTEASWSPHCIKTDVSSPVDKLDSLLFPHSAIRYDVFCYIFLLLQWK